MDAVILAGGVPKPGDPLWEETLGNPKALINICGKPMIQWVVDAVSGAASIHMIYIVGLPENFSLNSKKPIIYLPDQGGILANLYAASLAIIKDNPDAEYCLAISSDIPAISPEMVDTIANNIRPEQDIIFNVVPETLMQKSFPGIKRTCIRFREGRYSAADLHVINHRFTLREGSAAYKFVAFRKVPAKLIAVLGFDLLYRQFFNRPTLDETCRIIRKRTGIRVMTVASPYAETGMDIDKPEHLAVVRAKLAEKA